MRRTLSGLVIGLVLGTALIVGAQTVGVGRFTLLRIGMTTQDTRIRAGTGTPEAVVTGNVSDLFLRTDGADGTAFAYKASGSGNTGWAFPASSASTNTFTNKTYNAESTGNVLTLPFTEYWPANVVDSGAYSVGWNFHTPATDGPTDTTNGTGVSLYGTLRFDDSATESINRLFLLPADWTGNIDLTIMWLTAATTGNVVWQVQTFCIADNENMDPSTFTYNTAQTITDAAKGSASFLNTASLSNVTMTGCAAGELLSLKILRNPAHASDTLANYADLVGVTFTYRRAI